MDQDVLRISTENNSDMTIVGLSGELDSMNVADLTQAFTVLLDEGRRLFVLNLADLEFIDSAGLGGLVAIWERSMERGSFLALGAQSPRVREVLQITGLNSVLKSYDTMEEAQAAVRSMMEAFPQRSDAATTS